MKKLDNIHLHAEAAVERIFSDSVFKDFSETCEVAKLDSAELRLAAEAVGRIEDRYSKWLRGRK